MHAQLKPQISLLPIAAASFAWRGEEEGNGGEQQLRGRVPTTPSSTSPPSLMTPSSPRFMGAMISNLALVFGNIFSKRGMKGKSVSGMNYYAYLSIMSLVILTPFAIAMEGPQMWTAGWQKALANVGPNVIWWVGAQSVFYNLYNQVSYISLDEISPLTFSIGNTMKLISVIVSSIIIFHTPVTCPSCQCTRSCYCHPRHIPVFSGKTVSLRCWQGQGHG